MSNKNNRQGGRKPYKEKSSPSASKIVIGVLGIVVGLGLSFVGGMFLFRDSDNDKSPGDKSGIVTIPGDKSENSVSETSKSQQTDSASGGESEQVDGQALAEEFLKQFPSIFISKGMGSGRVPVKGFSEHAKLEEGQFATWDENGEVVITGEIPDIYYYGHDSNGETGTSEPDSGYYDKNGDKITDAIWLLEGDGYAGAFSLFDFENDGIPEILVDYFNNPNFIGGGSTNGRLFKYIDGEYKLVSFTGVAVRGFDERSWPVAPWCDYYYLDNNGKLVTFVTRMEMENYGGWYGYIDFDKDTAKFNRIATVKEGDTGFVWENHLTGEKNIPDNSTDPAAPHNIPGTDNLLTPIQPLTSMQKKVTDSVRQSLGY